MSLSAFFSRITSVFLSESYLPKAIPQATEVCDCEDPVGFSLTVAGIGASAVTSHRGDDAGGSIDLADAAVVVVGDEHVTRRIYSDAGYLPEGVAVDANDNLFFTEYYGRVRWVSPSGIMTTIAGTGTSGYNGDGVLATSANLYIPIGITLDSAGDVLFADSYNFRVRSVSAFPAVSTSVGSLAFGLTAVGTTSSPQQFMVSALGPVTISNIAASTNFSEADNCPPAMTNGSTCTMYVYFAPTASGSLNGSVTINNNGFFNQVNSVSLTGLGTSIAISGAPLAYGNQLVKTTSAAKSVTITNNGTAAVTMGTITSTNTTDYATSANTCPASGSTLAAKASCTISVTFGPQATGVKRGTLVINDNDPASPQLVGLSGNGISKVTLSPTQISFPVTPIGVVSAAQKITLTNTTGVSITLGNPAIAAAGPFVNATTTTCTNSLVIANNGTCAINVQFKPTVLGTSPARSAFPTAM